MGLTGLRASLGRLRQTPLHPQWFAFLRDSKNLETSCRSLSGAVLDIGCADMKPRRYLPENADYIGLDYYETATRLYKTSPDLFADAQHLPFSAAAIDHVLLLDVLEHLPDPERCLAEIHRVLRSGGTLTLQVPFMYPVHDAPLDFHRWTRHGLRRAADKIGFDIRQETAIGHPLESAALNANIALSKTMLNWIRGKNPLALLIVTLPVFVLVVNCAAWLAAALSRSDDLMPYAYRMVWAKT